jgi:dienelactone hydrolase
MTASKISFFLVLSVIAAGCVSRPPGATHVRLASANPAFLNEILDDQDVAPQRVTASLFEPRESGAPVPAVVILHTSFGQGAQDWHYAKIFVDWGYAVLAVDSFTARGIKKTLNDQTLVSEAAMIEDAYSALNYLSSRPEIDPKRIVVLGFSKGGSAAIYGSLARYADRLAAGGNGFAAYMAYYPWCGVRYLHPRATGSPMLIQGGADDDVTPPALCATLTDDLLRDNPGLHIERIVYPGTMHAFDHPLLSLPLAESIAKPGLVPAHCAIREVAENQFVEDYTGLGLNRETISKAIKACSATGASIAANPEAARQALEAMRRFLWDALGAPR